MVFDWDDLGANHVISDMCQTHDCRDKLDELHAINPKFKATMFTVPAEVTFEMADWLYANQGWIETAMHGFRHTSNYECEKWTTADMEYAAAKTEMMFPGLFVKGFKAPGWQVSTEVLQWLADNEWWVADQSYNNDRRPSELHAYVHNSDGQFQAYASGSRIFMVEAWHGHTWDCVGNGIYETFDQLSEVVKNAKDFQFIAEVLA